MIHVRREGEARRRRAALVLRDHVAEAIPLDRDIRQPRELPLDLGAHRLFVKGRGRLLEQSPREFEERGGSHREDNQTIGNGQSDDQTEPRG